MVDPGHFLNIMQTIFLPLTKSFFFGPSVTHDQRDEKINNWKKEVSLKGDSVAPNPPTVFEHDNGSACYVFTYATKFDIPDTEQSKKKK